MARRISNGYNGTNALLQPHRTPGALAALMVSKNESSYKQSIQKIQASAKFLADKLCRGQQVEQSLACSNKASEEENNAFLEEQRTLLKDIAAANVLREREIAWFLRAVNEISNETMRDDTDEGDTDDVPNFDEILAEKMEAFKNERSAVEVDVYDEVYCKEIRSRLGEKEQKKRPSSKKKGRHSADDDDDDDDLQIINEQSQANEEKHVKCPITGMFFTEPLKSKNCGHTYSKAGIEQMLRARKFRCPIPGCTNNYLSREQLEVDVEMEMRVERFKRNQERQEIKRRRIAEEDDEEEANFEEEHGLKTTVIS
jgi:hypothetical protein